MPNTADHHSEGQHWGEAPWDVPIALPVLPPPPRCDVLVVGAGFAGLSVAYHVARGGVRVVVMEAEAVGAGASGRTGGLVLEGTAAGPLDQVEHCLATIRDVVAEARIDCDLSLPGCAQVVHAARADGRWPGWRDGDQWIVASGEEPGGTVDPGKLVAGLAIAARGAGAEIYPSTAVQAIAPNGGRRYRVRCASGAEINAGSVVVTTNAYAPQLVSLPLTFRSALTLALCTAPFDEAALAHIGLAESKPFYTHDLPYLWGRRVPDGRLVFGAGLIFPSDGDVRTVDLAEPDAVQSMDRLETRVRGLHSLLADVRVTHRWGGPIAFRPGGAPYLSRLPDMPGVIVCAGCAGHGVALSIRVGQLIAAAVLDGARLPDWGALQE